MHSSHQRCISGRFANANANAKLSGFFLTWHAPSTIYPPQTTKKFGQWCTDLGSFRTTLHADVSESGTLKWCPATINCTPSIVAFVYTLKPSMSRTGTVTVAPTTTTQGGQLPSAIADYLRTHPGPGSAPPTAITSLLVGGHGLCLEFLYLVLCNFRPERLAKTSQLELHHLSFMIVGNNSLS
jgi:hypothetical protein